MMEDFPITDIILTLTNGTQEKKTTDDIISKIPVQFVVSGKSSVSGGLCQKSNLIAYH